MADSAFYDMGTGSITSAPRMPQIEDIDESEKDPNEIVEESGEYEYSVPRNSFTDDEEQVPDEPAAEEEEEEEEEKPVDPPTDEAPEEPEKPEETSDNEDPYKDHSEAAVYGIHLKESGFFDDDTTFEKDISHEDLVKQMIDKAEAIGVQNSQAALVQKYGSDEVLQAAEFLLKGGDPMYLNEGSVLTKLATLSSDEEANQEQLIRYSFKKKGVEDDNIDIFVETFRDRGDLEAQAVKASAYIKTLKTEHDATLQQQEEPVDYTAQAAARKVEIEKVVRGKSFGPYSLSENDANSLVDFTTNAKYIDKVNVNGVTQSRFVTGLDKALAAIANDTEKQMLIAKILLDDFKFDIPDKKTEDKTNALNYLNRKSGKGRGKKIIKNSYYRD